MRTHGQVDDNYDRLNWIVDADHDEAIKQENTEFMAAQIPGAGLLLQPEVSHFSCIQDPAQFNQDVLPH